MHSFKDFSLIYGTNALIYRLKSLNNNTTITVEHFISTLGFSPLDLSFRRLWASGPLRGHPADGNKIKKTTENNHLLHIFQKIIHFLCISFFTLEAFWSTQLRSISLNKHAPVFLTTQSCKTSPERGRFVCVDRGLQLLLSLCRHCVNLFLFSVFPLKGRPNWTANTDRLLNFWSQRLQHLFTLTAPAGVLYCCSKHIPQQLCVCLQSSWAQRLTCFNKYFIKYFSIHQQGAVLLRTQLTFFVSARTARGCLKKEMWFVMFLINKLLVGGVCSWESFKTHAMGDVLLLWRHKTDWCTVYFIYVANTHKKSMVQCNCYCLWIWFF